MSFNIYRYACQTVVRINVKLKFLLYSALFCSLHVSTSLRMTRTVGIILLHWVRIVASSLIWLIFYVQWRAETSGCLGPSHFGCPIIWHIPGVDEAEKVVNLHAPIWQMPRAKPINLKDFHVKKALVSKKGHRVDLDPPHPTWWMHRFATPTLRPPSACYCLCGEKTNFNWLHFLIIFCILFNPQTLEPSD